jgi:cytochrome c oxidase cbb3-type subunit I/II
MPPYPWLITDKIDLASTPAKIRTLQKLGVPYADGYDQIANDELMKQANEVAGRLRESGVEVDADTEIVALIAYLQRLGTDIKVEKK